MSCGPSLKCFGGRIGVAVALVLPRISDAATRVMASVDYSVP